MPTVYGPVLNSSMAFNLAKGRDAGRPTIELMA